MLYEMGTCLWQKYLYSTEEKKTYATERNTKCVHLVSFIIADSL